MQQFLVSSTGETMLRLCCFTGKDIDAAWNSLFSVSTRVPSWFQLYSGKQNRCSGNQAENHQRYLIALTISPRNPATPLGYGFPWCSSQVQCYWVLPFGLLQGFLCFKAETLSVPFWLSSIKDPNTLPCSFLPFPLTSCLETGDRILK